MLLILKALNILPFYSLYIFSVSVFIVKNMDKYMTNSDIHTIYLFIYIYLLQIYR
jgi:hypothetical protein